MDIFRNQFYFGAGIFWIFNHMDIKLCYEWSHRGLVCLVICELLASAWINMPICMSASVWNCLNCCEQDNRNRIQTQTGRLDQFNDVFAYIKVQQAYRTVRKARVKTQKAAAQHRKTSPNGAGQNPKSINQAKRSNGQVRQAGTGSGLQETGNRIQVLASRQTYEVQNHFDYLAQSEWEWSSDVSVGLIRGKWWVRCPPCWLFASLCWPIAKFKYFLDQQGKSLSTNLPS